MANGFNWQVFGAIVASGILASLGTGGVLSTTAPTVRDIEQINFALDRRATKDNIGEIKDIITKEVIRLDGWVDEVAKKQDDVRERLTVVESMVRLRGILNKLIIRIERLERTEERRP